jgi:hypothetical protein
MRRVHEIALKEVNNFIGPYNGAIVGAEISAKFNELRSVTALRLLGVKLVGDK